MTDDPARLHKICDRLGPATREAVAERWLAILPVPLTDADRASGYWWEISMRQIEVSRTIVWHARGPSDLGLITGTVSTIRRGCDLGDAWCWCGIHALIGG